MGYADVSRDTEALKHLIPMGFAVCVSSVSMVIVTIFHVYEDIHNQDMKMHILGKVNTKIHLKIHLSRTRILATGGINTINMHVYVHNQDICDDDVMEYYRY